MVESITTADAMIFPEYILPNLHGLASDPDVMVRATYAQCIATLAEVSVKFLELSQLLKNCILPESEANGNLYQVFVLQFAVYTITKLKKMSYSSRMIRRSGIFMKLFKRKSLYC
jgi:hypothetical protein